MINLSCFRRSSSKGTSGQQETTIAEEQQPDYEQQDKTLTEQLADQNNDQTRFAFLSLILLNI